jgi:hypothetical protein
MEIVYPPMRAKAAGERSMATRYGICLAALLVVASHALADDLALDAANILDAAVGDWNRDGTPDLALLAVGDEPSETGLYIYLRDPERGILDLALGLPGKIWGGRDFYGQEPSITALPNGSLAIKTQNFAIGRERWEHTLSVAYRNERFQVAGLTFSSFDTLQEYAAVACDLNLRTGKGVVNGKPVSFSPINLTIEEWDTNAGEDPGLVVCRGK